MSDYFRLRAFRFLVPHKETLAESTGVKTMGMTIRAILAAAIVVGMYVGRQLLDGWHVPLTGSSAEQDIHDLPWQLGEWKGAPWEADSDSSPQVKDAEDVENRQYSHPSAGPVNAHVTTTKLSGTWRLPHVPRKCHGSSGYEIKNRHILEIECPDGTTIEAEIMTCERERQRIYVLHWYQVGEWIVHDQPQMRKLAWEMRGKEAWPPVLKVMLTTAAPDEEHAVKQFQSLAGPLAEWAHGFH